jgi:hypothetical protein
MLFVSLPAYAFVILWVAQAWVLVTAGVGALIWLHGFISLSTRTRNEYRRERELLTHPSGRAE